MNQLPTAPQRRILRLMFNDDLIWEVAGKSYRSIYNEKLGRQQRIAVNIVSFLAEHFARSSHGWLTSEAARSELLTRDAELSHESVQGGPRHSETGSGLTDYAARFPQDPEDVLPLHVLESAVVGGFQSIGPQFGYRSKKVRASGEDNCPFNKVFEFSYIARP